MNTLHTIGDHAAMGDHPAQIRQECLDALAGVRLPRKYQRDAIASAMKGYTGRELALEPVPQARLDGASGLLCRGAKTDYVYYAAEANDLIQAWTVCHEWGHLLTGLELPTLPDVLIQRYGPEGVLLLAGYQDHFARRCNLTRDDPAERRAELIAELMYDGVRAARHGTGRTRSGVQVERDLLSRVFGPPR